MLVFKSVEDLREYLITRREMARRQGGVRQKESGKNEYPEHTKGMLFAFDESIRAVEALLGQEPKEESDALPCKKAHS